jgi:hypothetical protein
MSSLVHKGRGGLAKREAKAVRGTGVGAGATRGVS